MTQMKASVLNGSSGLRATFNRWMIVAVGTGLILTAPALADEKKSLWGTGRVEVVLGGGSPGGPCIGCDSQRMPGPDRYPVYQDDVYYDDRDVDFERSRERAKDRAEAAREFEKNRREAFRERAKDRQEWTRERVKAEQEAWKEREKARREWQKEREKADREAWKESFKERQ